MIEIERETDKKFKFPKNEVKFLFNSQYTVLRTRKFHENQFYTFDLYLTEIFE